MATKYVEFDHKNETTERITEATHFVVKSSQDKHPDSDFNFRYYATIESELPWFHDFVPYKGKIELSWIDLED